MSVGEYEQERALKAALTHCGVMVDALQDADADSDLIERAEGLFGDIEEAYECL